MIRLYREADCFDSGGRTPKRRTIREKKFDDLGKLNDFVNANPKIKLISIETFTYKEDTGLPLPRGTTFYATMEGKKLYYEEQD